jgi:hypothetical protein
MRGSNNIKGTWFQLHFVKHRGNGFADLELFEKAKGTGVRGLDVTLKPTISPRFFELKATVDVNPDQTIRHLTERLGRGEWRHFRTVTYPYEQAPGAGLYFPRSWAIPLLQRFETYAGPNRGHIDDILNAIRRQFPSSRPPLDQNDAVVAWVGRNFFEEYSPGRPPVFTKIDWPE